MAGAGYKLFNTGDVLTAAQVNTYLQEQVVMVFADATARTTALSGVLAEGMVSYLKDTNATEVYDGSAWVGIGNSGDITGVTAGTGISGGGTSGTVTITNDMATTITAAGDIVVGTGSGTYDNLPIGTTGQVLTADTTVSPYKVKWATASSGGGMTSIASGSLSGSQVNLTTISGSYKNLQLVVRDFLPSVDGASLRLRIGNDSGSNYSNQASFGAKSNTFGATSWQLSEDADNAVTESLIIVNIYDYANTATHKMASLYSYSTNMTTTSNFDFLQYIQFYKSTAAISEINLLVGSGTMGGSYILYGVS